MIGFIRLQSLVTDETLPPYRRLSYLRSCLERFAPDPRRRPPGTLMDFVERRLRRLDGVRLPGCRAAPTAAGKAPARSGPGLGPGTASWSAALSAIS